MQTAPVFKQASIRPGNKAVPAHLVLCSAGSLRCAGQPGRGGGGIAVSGKEQLLCGRGGCGVGGGGGKCGWGHVQSSLISHYVRTAVSPQTGVNICGARGRAVGKQH